MEKLQSRGLTPFLSPMLEDEPGPKYRKEDESLELIREKNFRKIQQCIDYVSQQVQNEEERAIAIKLTAFIPISTLVRSFFSTLAMMLEFCPLFYIGVCWRRVWFKAKFCFNIGDDSDCFLSARNLWRIFLLVQIKRSLSEMCTAAGEFVHRCRVFPSSTRCPHLDFSTDDDWTKM